MDTVQVTREQAKKLAHALIDSLIDMHDKGEWITMTTNITAGPKEGPMAAILFGPGTTKENAVGIQNTVAQALLNRNKG